MQKMKIKMSEIEKDIIEFYGRNLYRIDMIKAPSEEFLINVLQGALNYAQSIIIIKKFNKIITDEFLIKHFDKIAFDHVLTVFRKIKRRIESVTLQKLILSQKGSHINDLYKPDKELLVKHVRCLTKYNYDKYILSDEELFHKTIQEYKYIPNYMDIAARVDKVITDEEVKLLIECNVDFPLSLIYRMTPELFKKYISDPKVVNQCTSSYTMIHFILYPDIIVDGPYEYVGCDGCELVKIKKHVKEITKNIITEDNAKILINNFMKAGIVFEHRYNEDYGLNLEIFENKDVLKLICKNSESIYFSYDNVCDLDIDVAKELYKSHDYVCIGVERYFDKYCKYNGSNRKPKINLDLLEDFILNIDNVETLEMLYCSYNNLFKKLPESTKLAYTLKVGN